MSGGTWAMERKSYNAEFKQEAVKLVTEQGLSVKKAASDLGIQANMLARWKRESESHGVQAFPGQGNPHDAELAQLRREVELLRRERDILKKAVGIFSQQQP